MGVVKVVPVPTCDPPGASYQLTVPVVPVTLRSAVLFAQIDAHAPVGAAGLLTVIYAVFTSG